MILADENVPASTVEALKAAGLAVVRMADVDRGADDRTVLAHAVGHDLIVLTQDTDFGDLVYRDQLQHAGIVLVRLPGLSFEDKARRIVSLFLDEGDRLRHAFTVVSQQGVRSRS